MAVPRIFATQPAGNVPASYLDEDFAYVLNLSGGQYNVENYGAIGNGIADDTAAIQAAIDAAAAAGGGIVTFTGRYLIDSADITLKAGVSLGGTWNNFGEITGSTVDYSAVQSSIILNPSFTIRCVQHGCGVKGLVFLKKGLTVPANIREGIDLVATFAGTALTFASGAGDIYIGYCFFGGFAFAVHVMDTERPHIEYLQGDCTNGIYIKNCFDMDHLSHCHFWPFLTAHQAWNVALYAVSNAVDNGAGAIRLTIGANVLQTGDSVVATGINGITGVPGRFAITKINPTTIDLIGSTFGGVYAGAGGVYLNAYYRSGTAYNFDGSVDWGQADTCFSYNWATGFKITDSEFITLINCGHDGYADFDPSRIGIDLEGTCKAPALVSCKTAAQGTGIKLNITPAVLSTASITNHRIWACFYYGFRVYAGNANFTGLQADDQLLTGMINQIESTGGKVVLFGGDITNAPFNVVAGGIFPDLYDVVGDTVNQRLTTSGVSGSRAIADDLSYNSTPTNGDGYFRSGYITNSTNNFIEAVRETTRFSNVTAGAEQGQRFWSIQNAGAFKDVLLLASTTLAPVTNAACALGTPALGYSGGFYSSGAQIGWGNGNYTLTHASGKLTASGLMVTAATSSASAGLNLPHGAAPTAPADGDMWTTSSGLFVRISGVTVGPLS